MLVRSAGCDCRERGLEVNSEFLHVSPEQPPELSFLWAETAVRRLREDCAYRGRNTRRNQPTLNCAGGICPRHFLFVPAWEWAQVERAAADRGLPPLRYVREAALELTHVPAGPQRASHPRAPSALGPARACSAPTTVSPRGRDERPRRKGAR